MGNVMVIIDGMGDVPLFVPSELTRMGREGAYGAFLTRPASLPADSLPCIATLLGVTAARIPRGRAGVEALSRDICLDGRQAFRCSLIACDASGRLCSTCGGELSAAEKEHAFIKGAALCKEEGMELFYLGDYRGLITAEAGPEELAQVRTFAPHAHPGERWESLLPKGGALARKLARFAQNSAEILEKSGHVRLLPWDGAGQPALPSFASLHGTHGAAVCGADVVRGLARGMGMTLPAVPGATGDADTDLAAKTRTAISLSQAADFVLLHLGGADEAAHRRNPREKRDFLRRTGTQVVAPLLARPDISVLVCSDHATQVRTGAHAAFPQPFFLRKGGVRGNLGLIGGREAVGLLREGRRR